MNDPEFHRWQARFSGADGYLFGEEPNTFLREVTTILPQAGGALCVADGEGRNGVWLACRGLDVTSLDFSPVAQAKAAALAARHGVTLRLAQGDVHDWAYPEAAFDLVVEVFAQFSDPEARATKWQAMRRALRPGGVLLVHGYTPRQLGYATGGPKQLDKLYTEDLLREAFGDYTLMRLAIEERELQEGAGHSGMSATIGMVSRKPG